MSQPIYVNSRTTAYILPGNPLIRVPGLGRSCVKGTDSERRCYLFSLLPPLEFLVLRPSLFDPLHLTTHAYGAYMVDAVFERPGFRLPECGGEDRSTNCVFLYGRGFIHPVRRFIDTNKETLRRPSDRLLLLCNTLFFSFLTPAASEISFVSDFYESCAETTSPDYTAVWSALLAPTSAPGLTGELFFIAYDLAVGPTVRRRGVLHFPFVTSYKFVSNFLHTVFITLLLRSLFAEPASVCRRRKSSCRRHAPILSARMDIGKSTCATRRPVHD